MLHQHIKDDHIAMIGYRPEHEFLDAEKDFMNDRLIPLGNKADTESIQLAINELSLYT